jgi:hypothetical protein
MLRVIFRFLHGQFEPSRPRVSTAIGLKKRLKNQVCIPMAPTCHLHVPSVRSEWLQSRSTSPANSYTTGSDRVSERGLETQNMRLSYFDSFSID